MFICVICHITRAMWLIELVFIINIYNDIIIFISETILAVSL